jgi:hypothetical protein
MPLGQGGCCDEHGGDAEEEFGKHGYGWRGCLRLKVSCCLTWVLPGR